MAYLSREERREQIMTAVMELVSREGLAAATVRRIAQDLSISPGQIHHHFASAEAMRAEAVREVWKQLEPQLVDELAKLAPRERLIVVLTGRVISLVAHVGPVMLVAERLWKEAWDIRHDPAVREAIAEGIGKMREEITDTLREGVASGAFPASIDVEKTALRVIAAAKGYDMLHEIGACCSFGHEPDDAKIGFVEDLLRMEGI